MEVRRLLAVGMLPALIGLVLVRPAAAAQVEGAGRVSLPLGAAAPAKAIPSGQEFFKGAAYVGAETCRKCHAAQYEDWKRTWHANMEQLPTPRTVLGDFNNVTLVYKDLEVESVNDPKKKEKITPTVRVTTDGTNYFFALVDRDDERNNQTYRVEKTLGGKWDQGYEVKVGENYFPAPVRWSQGAKAWIARGFRAQEWFLGDGTPDGIPRKPHQLLPQRVAESKCAGCHTTGFTPAFDKDAKRFRATGPYELGISCEKCHGPGSLHAKEAEEAAAKGQRLAAIGARKIVHPLKDLNALQQNQLCAQCHGRNTNKKDPELTFPLGYLPGDTDMQDRVFFWSYSGHPDPGRAAYFWPNDWAKRNRQQWQDFTKSTHFTKTDVTCLSCHTFHGQWFEAQLRLPPERLCADCHTRDGMAKRPNVELYEGSPMAKAGVTCVDCHMAKLGHRTVATTRTAALRDVTSHTFMVATPNLTLRYGVRSACDACHTPGETKEKVIPLVPDAGNAMLKGRQAEIRSLADEAQRAVREARAAIPAAKGAGPSGPGPAAVRWRLAEAEARISLVLLDGSMGFHNFEKAQTLLKGARVLALEARKALARK